MSLAAEQWNQDHPEEVAKMKREEEEYEATHPQEGNEQ